MLSLIGGVATTVLLVNGAPPPQYTPTNMVAAKAFAEDTTNKRTAAQTQTGTRLIELPNL
jgi:hypothetical protein